MSDLTGTTDTVPATPLVVPPAQAGVAADPTGTANSVPADPLVVPPLQSALRGAAVARSLPARPTRPAVATGPARTPPAALAVTGMSSLPATLGSLALAGALWLRRRDLRPGRGQTSSDPA